MASPLSTVSFPPDAAVQRGRIRVLKAVEKRPSSSSPIPTSRPVVYWMFRDQRCRDNWALIHAVDLANRTNSPVAVVFNLFHRFLGAHSRQLGFMLRGLRQLHSSLVSLGIPFFLLRGDVVENVPRFAKEYKVGTLVTDFTPLREVRKWKEEICGCLDDDVVVHEVDAHNVVPLWAASGKLEFSARTIRSKINKLLPEYLIDFPELVVPRVKWMDGGGSMEIDWDHLIDDVLREGNGVPEIDWCKPGEEAAMEMLIGSKDGFLTKRLRGYSNDRNDPTKPKGLSCLSPYLHFGLISSQRCALAAQAFKKSHSQSVDAFLEELIVRRELADNYCFYQPQYDSLQGAWEWAYKTLMAHASDKRDHIYSKEELESAKTADPLWNASQLEMVHHGKMHGFMRMYWAKKILEWTSEPEEALSIAIYLNDKYEIDGRDPSGYVGCMWSICGVHDQGWRERPVFGKIRYMNYAGCKRKFDVDGYIAHVRKLVGDTKKRKLEKTDDRGFKESKKRS